MQRGEVDHILDAVHDIVVDADRPLEALAAMHHAMPHRLDLADRANDRPRLR